MGEKQESQESQIAVLYERYENIERKLEKIDKAVSGNGGVGLRQRMDRIQGGLIVLYVILLILAAVFSISLT